MVLYNLVLYYSLDPVLVIWHVTLIIFLQIQVFFSKLKKVSFGKSKLGHIKLGKTAVLVIFMLIYVNLCDGELSPSPEDNSMCLKWKLYVYYCNCILFCISSCFHWGRAKFNKLFHFLAFYMLVCLI